MSRPLRLGYLVPQFPGQTHIFFWRELAALKGMGVEPVLLSTSPPPPGLVSHEWSGEAAAQTTYLVRRDASSVIDAISGFPLRTLFRALRSEPAAFAKDLLAAVPAARTLLRNARKLELDHVHVHSCGRAAIIAALAFLMGGPRYSLTLHGPLKDYGNGQPFKWRHAAFATIITEKLLGEVSAALDGALPPAIAVQAMGVDTDRISRGNTSWVPSVPGEPVRLFSCGRLNRVKGHQDVFDAMVLLRDRGVDVCLTIAGEDDDGGNGYRAVLEERIKALGLSAHVTLLGAVSETEVLRQLCDAHIFVLASWSEPLGVALMEAMSCEVPTIGTRAGGVTELITDGVDGILVAPRNPNALSEAILGLLDNPVKARDLGKAGRQRIISNFGAKKSAQTLIEMINHVK